MQRSYERVVLIYYKFNKVYEKRVINNLRDDIKTHLQKIVRDVLMKRHCGISPNNRI